MEVSENRQGDGADVPLFVLTPHLAIADVERVQEQLESLFQHETRLMVDASALEKIDTAGMQLLCSLKKTLENSGGCLQWRGVTPVLENAASQLGVRAILELPAAAA